MEMRVQRSLRCQEKIRMHRHKPNMMDIEIISNEKSKKTPVNKFLGIFVGSKKHISKYPPWRGSLLYSATHFFLFLLSLVCVPLASLSSVSLHSCGALPFVATAVTTVQAGGRWLG